MGGGMHNYGLDVKSKTESYIFWDVKQKKSLYFESIALFEKSQIFLWWPLPRWKRTVPDELIPYGIATM